MVKNIEKIAISFMNDLFFKVAFGSENDNSRKLLKLILKYLTKLNLVDITIKNPEINPEKLKDKKIILDIHARDEEGRQYNIEMQTNKYSKLLYCRFQYYLCRLIVKALPAGKKYNLLPKTYQIIFMNDIDKSGKLIRRLSIKDEDNRELEYCLLYAVYVNILVIDRIVEEKGIDNLDDFELLIYLFKHGEDSDIMRLEDQGNEVLKIMSEKYNEFVNDDELYSWAAKIQEAEEEEQARIEFYQEEAKIAKEIGRAQGLSEGRIEGHIEGRIEGEIDTAIKFLDKQIKQKYHQEAKIWLEQLSQSELDKVSDEIYNCETLDELKNTIIK